jgi:hypothetical protein
MVASAVDWDVVVIGYLRDRLRPGKAGPVAGPSDE